MTKLKIRNTSILKAPAWIAGNVLVGFGKDVEVEAAIAHKLCRQNPKSWTPKGWELPALVQRKLKNVAGAALQFNGRFVPQDGILEVEESEALEILERKDGNWEAQGWTPQSQPETKTKDSSKPAAVATVETGKK